jgi:hypothetical protein
VTNYGTCAILALPRLPDRQLRFLLALETFKPDDCGWREAGTELLATTAGLSPRTVAKARGELVAAGEVQYRRGDGRGHCSTYRMRRIDDRIDRIKVATEAATFKGGKRGDHLSAQRWQPGSVKVANRPAKGGRRNAPTSANASGALKESALKESALPARVPVVEQLRAIDASVTEEVSAEVMKIIKSRPKVRDPVAVLDAELRKGNGYSLIGEAKHNIDRAQWRRQDPRVKRDDPERYDPADVVAGIRKDLGWARKHQEGDDAKPL